MKIELEVSDKFVEVINKAYQIDGLEGLYNLPYGIYICILKDLARSCCGEFDVSKNGKSLLNSDIEFVLKHSYPSLFEQEV